MTNKTLAVSSAAICALLLSLSASSCSGSSTSTNPPATPAVVSTSPVAGATGVAVDATVTVTFSEAMDPATIDATTFTVKDPTGTAVAGTVACSGTAATFAGTFTHLVTYTATVTTGARSLAGTALGSAHSWTFTVVTTPTPLLSRATLKKWIDVGLVDGTGSQRVVVLDVTSPTAYAAGHVPGAHLMNPADATDPIYQNRKEGPAVDINMVPDGSHMDSIVHKYGIDGSTTVVVTGPSSGSGVMSAGRVYWTFRYWGFAKGNLKFLDGLNGGFGGAYGLTTVAPPSIVPSTYSVKSNVTLRADLRASLPEMMTVASGGVANAVILDARTGSTAGSYSGAPGSTPGVFGGADFVVFEGHMKGAKALAYTDMFDATTFEFKSAAALTALLNPLGIDATKTAYVHCRTGVIAAVPFFALDAILGWPVVNYDGSWSQWGQMSADAANGGQLAATSPWRTDLPAYSELVVYNHANVVANKAVELLALDGAPCSPTLAASPGTAVTYSPAGCEVTPGFTGPDSSLSIASGNQIEAADALYMTTP